jgi:hypothetical protein
MPSSEEECVIKSRRKLISARQLNLIKSRRIRLNLMLTIKLTQILTRQTRLAASAFSLNAFSLSVELMVF